MDENTLRSLAELEEILGYHFADRTLLAQALTHSSWSGEKGGESYERLEFLGDAVLEVVVSEYLFDAHPDWTEGELTKERARIVCKPSLAFVAQKYGFDRFLLMTKGAEKSGIRKGQKTLCDVVEAILAAIYRESGFDAAVRYVEKFILANEKELPGEMKKDAKTMLQERVQQDGPLLPEYRPAGESGPPHDRVFRVECYYKGELLSRGTGKSKKEAEQNAAREALLKLEETVWN